MVYKRSAHLLMGGLLALMPALAGRAHAVDGVIEINQAIANKGGVVPGDTTPGFPITINTGTFSNEPMSVRLTGPLFNSTTSDIIVINSPHVTVDLNGFAIICLIPPCSGTAILSTQDNITVMNGTVRGFATGVDVNGFGSRIENMRAFGNTTGLFASSYCILRNNVASGNTGDGMRGGPGCTVIGNSSGGNGGDGIQAGSGSTVLQNAARNNMGFGLDLGTGIGYAQNVLSNNTAGNVDSGVQIGANVCDNALCP